MKRFFFYFLILSALSISTPSLSLDHWRGISLGTKEEDMLELFPELLKYEEHEHINVKILFAEYDSPRISLHSYSFGKSEPRRIEMHFMDRKLFYIKASFLDSGLYDGNTFEYLLEEMLRNEGAPIFEAINNDLSRPRKNIYWKNEKQIIKLRHGTIDPDNKYDCDLVIYDKKIYESYMRLK